MQPVIKVIRPFCFHKKRKCPQGLSLLAFGLYKLVLNKTKCHIKNEAEGIFLELVQNDGNNKSFKMMPELVPSGCMYAHALVLFSNDDPGLTLTIFMTGSNLFPYTSFCMGDSLYSIECSCISKFVLIQHVLSTQVSDTEPMVLWFKFELYGHAQLFHSFRADLIFRWTKT